MLHIDELIEFEAQQYHLRCETIRNDYKAGIRDCKNGIYDKFYRYNRSDDGQAYDAGWCFANKTEKVETVTFI